jgi:hypothetical protein
VWRRGLFSTTVKDATHRQLIIAIETEIGYRNLPVTGPLLVGDCETDKTFAFRAVTRTIFQHNGGLNIGNGFRRNDFGCQDKARYFGEIFDLSTDR